MSSWQNTPWGTLQVANGSEGQIIDRKRLKSFLGEDVAESRVFGKMHRQESSLTFRRLGGNCKTWKTISTSSVCLWRYLPSKAKANVWGQNLNCCDLLVSANFTWLCIVRRAKKEKVLFATQLADFPTFSSSLGGDCFFFVKKIRNIKINSGRVFCVAS